MNKSGIHKKKRDYRNAFALFPWPYRNDFIEEYEKSVEIEKWCEENLKDDFTAADAGIYIYEEADAVAFKMRWT